MRRVLLLTSHPLEGHDGADKELALAIAATSGSSSHFTWFGRAWPGIQPAISVGNRIPIMSRQGTPGIIERAQAAAWSLVLERRVDLIHAVFSIGRLSGAYARARRDSLERIDRRPVIHTVPGIVRPSRVRRSHALGLTVATSPYTADILRQCGFPDVRVIPLGVDLERWPLAPRSDAEPFRVLYAGHHGSGNEIEQVLLTAASLQDAGHRVAWTFALRTRPAQRQATSEQQVRARAQAYGLHEFKVIGRVNDMRNVIRSASALVFTPTHHYGTTDLPLVVLEAMAMGRPVVVSDFPALNVLGGSVVRVRAGDINATCRALVRLMSNGDEWEAVRRGARQRVEADFDANSMVRSYEELYDEVLRRG